MRLMTLAGALILISTAVGWTQDRSALPTVQRIAVPAFVAQGFEVDGHKAAGAPTRVDTYWIDDRWLLAGFSLKLEKHDPWRGLYAGVVTVLIDTKTGRQFPIAQSDARPCHEPDSLTITVSPQFFMRRLASAEVEWHDMDDRARASVSVRSGADVVRLRWKEVEWLRESLPWPFDCDRYATPLSRDPSLAWMLEVVPDRKDYGSSRMLRREHGAIRFGTTDPHRSVFFLNAATRQAEFVGTTDFTLLHQVRYARFRNAYLLLPSNANWITMPDRTPG